MANERLKNIYNSKLKLINKFSTENLCLLQILSKNAETYREENMKNMLSGFIDKCVSVTRDLLAFIWRHDREKSSCVRDITSEHQPVVYSRRRRWPSRGRDGARSAGSPANWRPGCICV